jgi:hypothetical protein
MAPAASTRLSITTSRDSCQRVPPSASRMLNSRPRAKSRTSMRFMALRHAMPKRSMAAVNRTQEFVRPPTSVRGMSLVSCSER